MTQHFIQYNKQVEKGAKILKICNENPMKQKPLTAPVVSSFCKYLFREQCFYFFKPKS